MRSEMIWRAAEMRVRRMRKLKEKDEGSSKRKKKGGK